MKRPAVLVVTRRTSRKHKYIDYVGEFHLSLLIRLKTLPLMVPVVEGSRACLSDYTRGMLGRLDPKTGAVREFPLPAAAQSLPYAMASDDRDRIWLAETGIQPNRLVGFDPKSESWISVTPVTQSGGLTIRHMIYNAPTKSLWFGTDANTIGRARVP